MTRPMHRRSTRSVFCTAMVVTLSPAAAFAMEPSGDWHDEYATALEEARSTGRPLLVHFSAEWCGPCKRMQARVLHEQPVLESLGTRVVGVHLDVDEHRDLAERFRVGGFPADVFVSPDGEVVVHRDSGYASVRKYLDRITEGTARFEQGVTVAARGR